MGELFEQFVRNFYAKEQSQYRVSASHVRWDVDETESTSGGLNLLPGMKTGICLESAKDKLIIDCKFYQDEKGTLLTWKLLPNGPTGTVIGEDGHAASSDYTDYVGNIFGSPVGFVPKGTFNMAIKWNVTFRCVSSRCSGGGTVSRTDHFDGQATFSVPWW